MAHNLRSKGVSLLSTSPPPCIEKQCFVSIVCVTFSSFLCYRHTAYWFAFSTHKMKLFIWFLFEFFCCSVSMESGGLGYFYYNVTSKWNICQNRLSLNLIRYSKGVQHMATNTQNTIDCYWISDLVIRLSIRFDSIHHYLLFRNLIFIINIHVLTKWTRY